MTTSRRLILEAAARAMWESEEGQPWEFATADNRAELARDIEPVVRAVLSAIAALPAEERDALLREAR